MIRTIAKTLIKRLKQEGFIIRRYDAYSTHSVYLKLDYGLAHSIRISDHQGKKHLSYRYNVILNQKKCETVMDDNGLTRTFYPPEMLEDLIAAIITLKRDTLQQYGDRSYKRLMQSNQEKHKHDTVGFWAQCRKV